MILNYPKLYLGWLEKGTIYNMGYLLDKKAMT